MLCKLLTLSNIFIWLVVFFSCISIAQAYVANDSIHNLSETMSTNTLVYIIIFLFATFFAVFGWLARKDRKNVDDKILVLESSKEDFNKFKVHVAETYVSRETLKDLVVDPNKNDHESIKDMISSQNEMLDKRMGQLQDLIMKAWGGP